jgi:hypothetical protein
LVGKAYAEYAHKKAKADATGVPRREYARVGAIVTVALVSSPGARNKKMASDCKTKDPV